MVNPFEMILERLARIEEMLTEKESTKKPEPGSSETDRIFDVKQAANFLNSTPGSIYQLIHKGQIPYAKRGRIYFSEKELRTWIQTGRRQTVQEIQHEAIKALER
jgi:excisionase family DNA binding protein